MNEQNEKFLQDTLFYTGFGERLHAPLTEAMQQGKPEFTLSTMIQHDRPNAQPGATMKDSLFFELHFKKGKTDDRYFFNSYKANLVGEGLEDRTQLFYINKNKGVTTKEAYNLLSGRAVNKDMVNKAGEKYNAWLQLNFEEKDRNGNYKMNVYHENYDYHPEQVLGKLPIKPMGAEQKEMALQSLKKGNLVPVTLFREGQAMKAYMAANPKFKMIQLLDDNGREIMPVKKEKEESLSESQKKTIDESPAKQKETNATKKPAKAARKPRVRADAPAKGQGIRV